ncbi:MAG: DUF4040 domain-containing protein [Eubacteriales bacterium]
MMVVEVFVLAMMIVLAIVSVSAMKLRRAIIYMGAFSLLSSFVYLLANAPDVAIAEAVIGCTISVILLLTALKKYRIMTIYYVEDKDCKVSQTMCEKFIDDLEKFLVNHDFEPQLVRTSLDDESLHEQDKFDLLVVGIPESLNVYSGKENLNMDLVEKFMKESDEFNEVMFISMIEETDYDG